MKKLALAGKEFGLLVVLEPSERVGNGVWWRCRCRGCGRVTERLGSTLKAHAARKNFVGCRACAAERTHADRDGAIAALFVAGKPVREIAAAHRITRSRVEQIVGRAIGVGLEEWFLSQPPELAVKFLLRFCPRNELRRAALAMLTVQKSFSSEGNHVGTPHSELDLADLTGRGPGEEPDR